jgi:L-iditol 2-dehydrogenase
VRFPGSAPIEGSLAELYVHPAELCEPLPDAMTYAHGAMLEPLGVVIHALTLAKIRPGDTVAILGGGPIGLMMVQVALASATGAVYLSEPIAERRALADRLGASAVCDPTAEDPVAWIMHRTNGRGVDIAIETAWGGDAVGQAVRMARPAGKVILVGIPREDVTTFPASPARRKGLSILLSRRMKFVYPRAIALVERGVVDLDAFLTHRFPLERAAEAFELVAGFADGVVKAMIDL